MEVGAYIFGLTKEAYQLIDKIYLIQAQHSIKYIKIERESGEHDKLDHEHESIGRLE